MAEGRQFCWQFLRALGDSPRTQRRLAGYEQDLFDLREQVEAIMHVHVVALEAFVGELERVEPGRRSENNPKQHACMWARKLLLLLMILMLIANKKQSTNAHIAWVHGGAMIWVLGFET